MYTQGERVLRRRYREPPMPKTVTVVVGEIHMYGKGQESWCPYALVVTKYRDSLIALHTLTGSTATV